VAATFFNNVAFWVSQKEVTMYSSRLSNSFTLSCIIDVAFLRKYVTVSQNLNHHHTVTVAQFRFKGRFLSVGLLEKLYIEMYSVYLGSWGFSEKTCDRFTKPSMHCDAGFIALKLFVKEEETKPCQGQI
jgi:hypothetical protein